MRGDWATLTTAIEKDCVAAPPPASLACTVTECVAGPSSRALAPFATVTTPVVALTANRPPALSARAYETAVPFGSVEEAVTPTAVPAAAPSDTTLAAGSP